MTYKRRMTGPANQVATLPVWTEHLLAALRGLSQDLHEDGRGESWVTASRMLHCAWSVARQSRHLIGPGQERHGWIIALIDGIYPWLPAHGQERLRPWVDLQAAQRCAERTGAFATPWAPGRPASQTADVEAHADS